MLWPTQACRPSPTPPLRPRPCPASAGVVMQLGGPGDSLPTLPTASGLRCRSPEKGLVEKAESCSRTPRWSCPGLSHETLSSQTNRFCPWQSRAYEHASWLVPCASCPVSCASSCGPCRSSPRARRSGKQSALSLVWLLSGLFLCLGLSSLKPLPLGVFLLLPPGLRRNS